MDAISSIIPSEREPIKGFKTHVSTPQESRHTISYMVRKQTRGPCKLLLQAHRPEWCSSVLVWHYQAPLQKHRGGKMVLLQNVKDTSGTNWRVLIHAKGAWCFYLKWVVTSSAETQPHGLFWSRRDVVNVLKVTQQIWAPCSHRIIQQPVKGDLT